MSEIKVVDADVVELQLAPLIDAALEKAPGVAALVKDDAGRAQAVSLGVEVKGAIGKIEAEREDLYVPLYKATERLRAKYDDRIKSGKAILKLLSSAVSDFDIKKRREAELAREKAEAEARKIREEAERKRREAEDAERHAKEAAAAEVRRRQEAEAAEARRVQAEKEVKERQERERREAEQAELDRKRQEEQDARLKHAQEAEGAGNGEARVDNILGSTTPIASVVASPQLAIDKVSLAAQQKLVDEAAARKAEEETKEAAAAAQRQQEAEAAAAKARADAEAAEAAAAASEAAATAVIATRPDDQTRKNTSWKWIVRDEAALRKLLKAIVEGRAPIEYLGYHSERTKEFQPEKFRTAIIGKDVTKDKEMFRCEGIETWPEQTTNFVASKETA